MDLAAIGFVVQFGKHYLITRMLRERRSLFECCEQDARHSCTIIFEKRWDLFCLHRSRTFFCLRNGIAIRNGYTLGQRNQFVCIDPQVRCVKIELLQASNSRTFGHFLRFIEIEAMDQTFEIGKHDAAFGVFE